MTCIAWDGLTLAVDRQCTSGSNKFATNKLFKVEGCLVAICGDIAVALQCVEWLSTGDGKWPPKKGDNVELVVIRDGDCYVYESDCRGFPIQVEGAYACGDGKDFALAAMHLGKSAREAVQVAAALCPSVGMGVNTAKG